MKCTVNAALRRQQLNCTRLGCVDKEGSCINGRRELAVLMVECSKTGLLGPFHNSVNSLNQSVHNKGDFYVYKLELIKAVDAKIQ